MSYHYDPKHSNRNCASGLIIRKKGAAKKTTHPKIKLIPAMYVR